MSVADRDLRKLKQPVREARRKMEQECHDKWLYIFVTEAKRSSQRQKELYAQWRTKPGKVVTRTMHSRHLVGDAFDIAWDPKHHGSLYPNNNKLWMQVGEIGESYWLERWGRWKVQDKPHFQWSSSWWSYGYTPNSSEEEEDIYKKLYDYLIQLIDEEVLDKSSLKNLPDDIWDYIHKIDLKEIVVEYLDTLDRNELAEEFVYILSTLWKKK